MAVGNEDGGDAVLPVSSSVVEAVIDIVLISVVCEVMPTTFLVGLVLRSDILLVIGISVEIDEVGILVIPNVVAETPLEVVPPDSGTLAVEVEIAISVVEIVVVVAVAKNNSQ